MMRWEGLFFNKLTWLDRMIMILQGRNSVVKHWINDFRWEDSMVLRSSLAILISFILALILLGCPLEWSALFVKH